jgi:hypothetical protein
MAFPIRPVRRPAQFSLAERRNPTPARRPLLAAPGFPVRRIMPVRSRFGPPLLNVPLIGLADAPVLANPADLIAHGDLGVLSSPVSAGKRFGGRSRMPPAVLSWGQRF